MEDPDVDDQVSGEVGRPGSQVGTCFSIIRFQVSITRQEIECAFVANHVPPRKVHLLLKMQIKNHLSMYLSEGHALSWQEVQQMLI